MGIRSGGFRASVRVIGAVALAATVVLGGAVLAASAAPGQKAGKWATFAVASPTSGSMTVVAGFPNATISTNAPSFAAASNQVLSATTAPGVEYGSSTGSTYLSLRPLSDGTASTTTITFAQPTPASFWSFVLGDVDAESVTISATGPGGPIAIGDLGFVGTFNYAGAPALPTWTPGVTSGVLSGGGPDTNGASGWFTPTAQITSITVQSTRLSGVPTSQFWIVGKVASLAGLVVDPVGVPVPNATVTVTVNDPTGAALPGGSAVVTTDAAGAFDVPEVFGVPVSLIATAPDRLVPAPIAVTPTLDVDGDPVFASAVTVPAGALIAPVIPVVPVAPAAIPTLPATGAPFPWWLLALGLLAVLAGSVLNLRLRIDPSPARKRAARTGISRRS